jgi:hypothetical protein
MKFCIIEFVILKYYGLFKNNIQDYASKNTLFRFKVQETDIFLTFIVKTHKTFIASGKFYCPEKAKNLIARK